MAQQHVYINAIAAFLPNAPVSNNDMEAILGQAGGRPSRARKIILRSNGITTRYYAIDPLTGKATHTNAQLTAEAIRALSRQGCKLETIEVLSCGTTLPDQLMPNHGVMVQGELNLPPCEVAAMAGICVSGIMALKYGYLSIRAGDARSVVATGSENVSSLLRGHMYNTDPEPKSGKAQKSRELDFGKDFLRWMLSDGAGAVWLTDRPCSKGISLRIDWIEQISYAGEMETCMYAGAQKAAEGSLCGWRSFLPEQCATESIFTIKQDIKLLNEEIIKYTVTTPLAQLMEKGRITPGKIDWFLPHYSSLYFKDRVFAGLCDANCEIPLKKWFTNLSTKGNTGSASMYIILEELFNSGKLETGQTLLCYTPESGRFSTSFMQLTVV